MQRRRSGDLCRWLLMGTALLLQVGRSGVALGGSAQAGASGGDQRHQDKQQEPDAPAGRVVQRVGDPATDDW